MNGLKDAINSIAANADKAAGQKKTHIVNGIKICDVCGEPVQAIVQMFGEERIVSCTCQCDKEAEIRERAEAERAARRRQIELLKADGFRGAEFYTWTFEHDDGKDPDIIRAAKKYAEKFDFWRTRKRERGLLFSGGVGTGKTFAAACIANYLMDRGKAVLMTNFAQIVNRLQDNFEGRQKYIDGLNNYDLLIIDDLATERDTEFVNEAIFAVIDGRYRAGLPLVITTNIPLNEIYHAKELRKKRIYSRICEMCYPLEAKGNDRRREIAEQSYEEARRLLEV